MSLSRPHLYFYLPGLFQPLMLWRKDFAFQPVADSFLRLCASVETQQLPVIGLENTLLSCLGHPAGAEIPFAHYRYQLDFAALPKQPLMCADPVFLQSGIDQVLLQPELPMLTMDAVTELLYVLNKHLAEDGLQLCAAYPQRWYLCGEKVADPDLRTTPLSQALGQGIFPLLPQGNKRYWHRLLNEIQMVLHSHGNTSTNALWLWGAAAASHQPGLQVQAGFVGSSITAKALAHAGDIDHQAAGKLAECRFESGDYHIILEELLLPAVSDNPQQWQQAMHELAENWFLPALNGLKSGKFEVSLSSCDGRILHCQPPSSWKFWQTRAASWDQLLQSA